MDILEHLREIYRTLNKAADDCRSLADSYLKTGREEFVTAHMARAEAYETAAHLVGTLLRAVEREAEKGTVQGS